MTIATLSLVGCVTARQLLSNFTLLQFWSSYCVDRNRQPSNTGEDGESNAQSEARMFTSTPPAPVRGCGIHHIFRSYLVLRECPSDTKALAASRSYCILVPQSILIFISASRVTNVCSSFLPLSPFPLSLHPILLAHPSPYLLLLPFFLLSQPPPTPSLPPSPYPSAYPDLYPDLSLHLYPVLSLSPFLTLNQVILSRLSQSLHSSSNYSYTSCQASGIRSSELRS